VRQHVTEGLESRTPSEPSPEKRKPKKKKAGATKDKAAAAEPATPRRPPAAAEPATPRRPPAAAEPATPRRPPAAAEPATPRRPAAASSAPPSPVSRDVAAVSAPSVAPEERLPLRVFGKNFELDAKIGAGVRGWYPEQYPLVGVDHASFV